MKNRTASNVASRGSGGHRLLGAAVLAGCLIAASGAAAGEPLSCRVQAGQIKGAAKAPKTTEFIWSAARDASEHTGSLKTSLGRIDQVDGPGDTTAISLNGRPIKAPAATAGQILFGRVYDYGGKVAMAFLVERRDDSSASPSHVVLLMDRGGVVSDTDILPGTASNTTGHCTLIQ